LTNFYKALSDFADYVQKQQEKRRPLGQQTLESDEEHDELAILDTLGLTDDTKAIRLKDVLLDTSPTTVDDSVNQLAEYLKARLEEGRGEALLDLGLFEENGDDMGFDQKDWDFALARMIESANKEKSDIKVLMTRNVGGDGDVEVGPISAAETALSGKIMIRRRAETVNDAIETRIAVVGNGRILNSSRLTRSLISFSRCWKVHHAWSARQRRPG